MIFIPLPQYDNKSIVTGAHGEPFLMYSKVFIVENYNSKLDAIVDSFANSQMKPPLDTIGSYKLVFYKGSSKTNVDHLSENPRDLVRYSQDNDLIFDYNWNYGKFSGKAAWKDGRMISIN